MIKISPSILNSVLKPARYTGGELNSVIKDHNKVEATIALALPDVYEVGMSNLGLKILYEVLMIELTLRQSVFMHHGLIWKMSFLAIKLVYIH